jgi:hypothetical protein
MLKTLITAVTGILLVAFGISAPVQANQASQLLRFQVYLDDKPIGEHSFRIAGSGDTRRVSSRAAFDVDFLFINAYRYRHSSSEVFRDGCLQEISATTDDNGKAYQVEGVADGNSLRIQDQDTLPGCVMTFAYWNRDFLQQRQLLNPQTGELERVSVQSKGTDRIEAADGRELSAERYALTTDELTIDLWYNDDMGWVGLASDTGKGPRIIYRRL